MKLTVEIPGLLYKNIESYCKANNLVIDDFIYNTISDRLYSEIYGDINPKTDTKEPALAVDEIIVEDKTEIDDEKINKLVDSSDSTTPVTIEDSDEKKSATRPRRRKLQVK